MGKLAENMNQPIGMTQIRNNRKAAPYVFPNLCFSKLENHNRTIMNRMGIRSKKKLTPLVMVIMAHISTMTIPIKILYFMLFTWNLL